MKIIDIQTFGNVIKFYLGDDDCTDYWGDDWDDAPYEHNAGTVYDEYVTITEEYAIPTRYSVLQPISDFRHCDGVSKQDMKNHKIPCLILTHDTVDSWDSEFYTYLNADDAVKIYYDMSWVEVVSMLHDFGAVHI